MADFNPLKRRLSTPAPLGVPRFDDFDANLDYAFDDSALSLPRLTLGGQGVGIDKLFEKRATARSKARRGASGGAGVSAYGYSGQTGIRGTRGPEKYGFQTPMWQALGRANAAMKAAGLGEFGITDGWRSYQQQVDLKRRKPNLAATPGRSIHGLGLAADLKLNDAQFQWMQQNAGRFGLVNPVRGESWHWQHLPGNDGQFTFSR